jgi:site-specific DNA-methyltransferase (adenine-specific)
VTAPRRTGTSTSNFGVGRREGHDASAFYDRFPLPVIDRESKDLVDWYPLPDDGCFVGDSRVMDDRVKDGSVALVVTSPPYFAGKAYEEELGEGHIPASYVDYLRMLHDVFATCVRKLEPGGRIAVNVANLGRKPYRSLSADIIRILQDELHLLLRGEVIWRKADGAGGNCAWGSFRSPSNPVLRDLTERVIIASKGRFDRAQTPAERKVGGYPYEPHLLTNDDFMAATLDVWEIPPESATRVNHPAPFPVALPELLIKLYTYKDDLVLDPFLGSGSTVVAAARTGRRGAGYDMEPTYVEIARERVRVEVVQRTPDPEGDDVVDAASSVPSTRPAPDPGDDFQARASREGKAAQDIALDRLIRARFQNIRKNQRLPGTGVRMNFVAEDANGDPWYFDVSGAFTTIRGGLIRTDTTWKALGRANVLRMKGIERIVFITSHLPKRGSEGYQALKAAGPGAFFDAIEMYDDDGLVRLARYATGAEELPLRGFWSEADLARI